MQQLNINYIEVTSIEGNVRHKSIQRFLSHTQTAVTFLMTGLVSLVRVAKLHSTTVSKTRLTSPGAVGLFS